MNKSENAQNETPSGREPCRHCKGTGKYMVKTIKKGEIKSQEGPCPHCAGRGTKGLVTK